MSGVMTKWVVLMQHDVGAADIAADGVLLDDVIERWVSETRGSYLDCCPRLRERCATSGLTLCFRNAELPSGERFGPTDALVVSAGVTEVYPTSFTIAFRLRPLGPGDNDDSANVTCTVTLEDPATGQACEISDAVRDELIALEHAARHYN